MKCCQNDFNNQKVCFFLSFQKVVQTSCENRQIVFENCQNVFKTCSKTFTKLSKNVSNKLQTSFPKVFTIVKKKNVQKNKTPEQFSKRCYGQKVFKHVSTSFQRVSLSFQEKLSKCGQNVFNKFSNSQTHLNVKTNSETLQKKPKRFHKKTEKFPKRFQKACPFSFVGTGCIQCWPKPIKGHFEIATVAASTNKAKLQTKSQGVYNSKLPPCQAPTLFFLHVLPLFSQIWGGACVKTWSNQARTGQPYQGFQIAAFQRRQPADPYCRRRRGSQGTARLSLAQWTPNTAPAKKQ